MLYNIIIDERKLTDVEPQLYTIEKHNRNNLNVQLQ